MSPPGSSISGGDDYFHAAFLQARQVLLRGTGIGNETVNGAYGANKSQRDAAELAVVCQDNNLAASFDHILFSLRLVDIGRSKAPLDI
ncbi:hypothetical protein MOMUL_04840 [Moorella mulderi DSM 14980]|uniref:Uncharacterized protein n=1 Tax=Moorella mulderi DSM 14980 TaxID=1122241 RepID=A0A151B1I4_9FIRM|nr:hypothetical protein MOMUL_04840 [Moorella mulderi DSM 14980]